MKTEEKGSPVFLITTILAFIVFIAFVIMFGMKH